MKPTKVPSMLTTCGKCQSSFSQKDVSLHESNCPPSSEHWNHGFVRDRTLHGTLEICKAQDISKHITEKELDDMVFLSHSVLQLCEIAIGDPVIVASADNVVIKTAWPTDEGTLTSVLLTKIAIELNALQSLIKVQKLEQDIFIAKEFVIRPIGKYSSIEKNTDLETVLKSYNECKIFCVGNKIGIPYYGRKLVYQIMECRPEKSNERHTRKEMGSINFLEHFKALSLQQSNEVQFYKALYSTKWLIYNEICDKSENRVKLKEIIYKLEDIGGYDTLISDVRDIIDVGLDICKNIGDFNISRGILLYGTIGVGKSMIASALTSTYSAIGVNVFIIKNSIIYSKSVSETEQKLNDILNEAIRKAPSIIFLDDIDTFCPRRSNSNTDYERRILGILTMFFDQLQATNGNVSILTTTSRLDSVDPCLRRTGRIDKEFEVYVPTPAMRLEILTKLLLKIPNNLSKDDVSYISFVTHGFVGADLYGLCSQAIMNRIKKQKKIKGIKDTPEVSMEDFQQALTVTKPSAMKEVLIEVPNVRWSDIGGQKNLKMQLKQAIEWPLKHPEAFIKMGITPPKGVLMFGPPGCSKTMIAKALATESQVNFLSIKGPELFSKWVGESERAVREVFRRARQVAPSIIFIDEIDVLGGERTSSSGTSGSNVQERVLAQLLTELDGITALGNVTLVAATNRPDKIDKALLRPGRLDRIIYVPLPDYNTREDIFNIKLNRMPIAEDVNIRDLVELTEGYSGAEIQAICHEAAMKALEEDLAADKITKEHFKIALCVVTPRTPASLIRLYDEYMDKTC